MWRLKAPEKKPLVRREGGNNGGGRKPVRRASQKRVNHQQEMSNFHQNL